MPNDATGNAYANPTVDLPAERQAALNCVLFTVGLTSD